MRELFLNNTLRCEDTMMPLKWGFSAEDFAEPKPCAGLFASVPSHVLWEVHERGASFQEVVTQSQLR